MIQFQRLKLDNGLTLIIHPDPTTPVGVVNLLYDVGARDEDPLRTGFAHLFEHLMFGGSANIPDFDKPLQAAGGTSNAFTSNDITNYYETIPVENLDTLLWLESDRMLSLAFTPKSLEVQRSVVIEEFKQRYLNQPYGDVWHILRQAAYKVHPYQWPTIGKDISHIEEATLDDVKAFFYKHYTPANAILCVGGNVDVNHTTDRVNHWFGDIPCREQYVRNLPQEPQRTEGVLVEVERDVPQSLLIKAWAMPHRLHPDYHAVDLVSDLLGRGRSSRLHRSLVMEQRLFNEIHCYVSGDQDSGLLTVSGMVAPGVDMEKANEAVNLELTRLMTVSITEEELTKVKNKYLSSQGFEESSLLSKAMNLCYFQLLGDAALINTEEAKYRKVSVSDVARIATSVIQPQNEVKVYYHSTKQKK